MDTKQRILWPDISKGIGIIMVVFFHSIITALKTTPTAEVVFALLQETHMPLFFFVSGWLFELKADRVPGNKGRAIWSRFKRLMVPYFVFSAIYYILTNIALEIDSIGSVLQGSKEAYGHYPPLEIVRQILTLDNRGDRHMAISLWFLYTLFIISVINILLPKLTRHPAFVAAIAPLCMLPRFFPDFFDRSEALKLTLYYLFFFCLARALFPLTDRIFNMKKSSYALVILGYAALSFAAVLVLDLNRYGLPVGLAHHLYPIVREAAAVFGILFICTTANYIRGAGIARPLIFLGQKSMIIYLIHAPILTQAVVAMFAKLAPGLPLIIYFLAGTVVGIAVPLLIDWLIISRVPLLNTILTGAPYKKRQKPTTNN